MFLIDHVLHKNKDVRTAVLLMLFPGAKKRVRNLLQAESLHKNVFRRMIAPIMAPMMQSPIAVHCQ